MQHTRRFVGTRWSLVGREPADDRWPLVGRESGGNQQLVEEEGKSLTAMSRSPSLLSCAY